MSEQETQCPADTLRTPAAAKRRQRPNPPAEGILTSMGRALFGDPRVKEWHERMLPPLRNLAAAARHGSGLAMWVCGGVTFMLVCAWLVHYLYVRW